jgi:hypothetical protein
MANHMKGLRLKPTYEQLIGVAVSDKLYNVKFPNRTAQFLRNGFVLSQLDGEGQRAMEKQQEMASKEAFKESLLKEIAINTGSNLHDLRSDSEADRRRERFDSLNTPPRNNRPETYDMTENDDDMQSLYSLPISSSTFVSDYSGRINRQLDFEEEEQDNSRIRQESKREKTRQELSEHLDDLQPKRRIDVDTKVLTRNYLDRIYENVSEMERTRQEFQRELRTPEKASGSRDPKNYGDDPEESHPPKGKRGGAKGPKPRHVKETEREMRQEIERGFQEVEESNLNSADVNTWRKKHLKTVIKEYNNRTGSNIVIKKVRKQRKAYDEDDNEITKEFMIKVITEQNKTMASQATRGMKLK